MSVIQKVERKGYGFTALLLAMFAALAAIGYDTTRAYNILCLSGGSGCLSESTNSAVSAVGVVLIVLGGIAAILGLLAAVESIANMEKTKKAYVALSILAITLIAVSSGLIYLVIRNTAYSIFG